MDVSDEDNRVSGAQNKTTKGMEHDTMDLVLIQIQEVRRWRQTGIDIASKRVKDICTNCRVNIGWKNII